jgi:hypothetical protein
MSNINGLPKVFGIYPSIHAWGGVQKEREKGEEGIPKVQ